MKHFDGYLYATIAVAGSIAASLSTDEAFNLFQGPKLFWGKAICGCIGAGALAVKMYRSTTFAQIKSDSTPDSTVITETRKESVPPVVDPKAEPVILPEPTKTP